MLHEEVELYSRLTGKDGYKTPICVIGAYLDGYEKGKADAEPQERKTGEWIHDGSHWANRWICDRCGYKLFGVKTKYCPDCGQRMEVDNEQT